MHKQLLLVFMVFIGLGTLSAQMTESSIGNAYSNHAWITDSIFGFKDNQFGLRIWDAERRWERIHIQDSIEADSNSYSFVDYSLGVNASQHLGGYLIRPIDKSSAFEFSLKRESMPGWMSRSFARKTDLDVSYQRQLSKRWSIYAGAGIDVWDREQNGGLTGTDYSIDGDDANAFSNIYGETFLTNSYNRHDNYWASVENKFEVTQTDRSSLDLIAAGAFGYGTYRFEDAAPDSVFYSSFTKDSVGELSDSTSEREARGGAFLRWTWDSDSLSRLVLDVGTDLHFFRISSNAQTLNAANQELYTRLSGAKHRLYYGLQGVYNLSGYNGGDYAIDARLRLKLIDRVANDSSSRSAFGLSIYAEGHNSLRRAALIYSRYNSGLGVVRNDLNRIGKTAYEVGLDLNLGGGRLMVTGGGDQRSGYVYLDSTTNVLQLDSTLGLLYTRIHLGYSGDHFEVFSNLTYQWNERSLVYSLPEWLNHSRLATQWPLLNKKLSVKLGGELFFFSSYYARGYVPVYDLFYVQTERKFGDYTQLDAFTTFTIRSVNITLAMVNLSYGWFSDDPLVGPYYPSVPRYFRVGVNWKFKN